MTLGGESGKELGDRSDQHTLYTDMKFSDNKKHETTKPTLLNFPRAAKTVSCETWGSS